MKEPSQPLVISASTGKTHEMANIGAKIKIEAQNVAIELSQLVSSLNILSIIYLSPMFMM
jgi:hypothetical protein